MSITDWWFLMHQSKRAIFLLFFDNPNLTRSPLVPADSNNGKIRAVLSGFYFAHQHYSTASLNEGEGWGESCLRPPLPSWCSVQHSWFGSNYSGHISVVGKEKKHVITKIHPFCWNTQVEYMFHFCWTLNHKILLLVFCKISAFNSIVEFKKTTIQQ